MPVSEQFEYFLKDFFTAPTLEKIGAMQHQSAWPDVVAKAVRLIQSGNVTILRNAPHHVMAHVVGDHGEYDTEIQRTDPTSQVIEQWTCECPWSQFAFGRTRKWKKFEGRVCSHVLAAYWKARGTPLDTEEQTPEFQVPGGQVGPGTIPGQQQMRAPVPEEANLPRSFGPETEQEMTGPSYIEQLRNLREKAMQRQEQGETYLPGGQTQQDIAIPQQPESPFRYPRQPRPAPRQQLQLFDITAPPGGQPVPPTNPVSIPGGRPQSPANPVTFPGTFSKVSVLYEDEFHYGADVDDFTQWAQTLLNAGQTPLVRVTAKGVMLEARGGKIPLPGAQPIGMLNNGMPRYRVRDLGWHPQEERRVDAREGAPEQRNEFGEVAQNSRAEIIEVEPLLKQACIIVPINDSGPLHPHLLQGWVGYSDLRPEPNATTPFVIRKR